MKKIILSLSLLALIPFLTGCDAKPGGEKEETINPLSPSSMVNTYEGSKEKINNTVEKQNDNINKALEDSGLNE